MKLKVIALVGIGGLLTAAAAGAQLMRSGYEGPSYEVIQADGKFEIRAYESRIVAETAVSSSDWRKSTSTGFSRLAGYIFGGNEAEDGQSTKIAMTSPVESVPGSESDYTVVFTMPSNYNLQDLPVPNDERIRLLQRPGGVIAVRRYSGGWSEKAVAENRQVLLDALAEDGVDVLGDPELARYDSPFKPWFLRRNEILIPIDWSEQGERGTP